MSKTRGKPANLMNSFQHRVVCRSFESRPKEADGLVQETLLRCQYR
jgi:hypothetical protein